MTNQEKKKYLDEYRILGQRIERKCEELARMQALAEKITPTLSDLPKCPGQPERMALQVEQIIAYNEQINEDIREYISRRNAIVKAINSVDDLTLRTLLEHRYLDGKTWEEIAVKMHYSYMHICRLHGIALSKLML